MKRILMLLLLLLIIFLAACDDITKTGDDRREELDKTIEEYEARERGDLSYAEYELIVAQDENIKITLNSIEHTRDDIHDYVYFGVTIENKKNEDYEFTNQKVVVDGIEMYNHYIDADELPANSIIETEIVAFDFDDVTVEQSLQGYVWYKVQGDLNNVLEFNIHIN